MLRIVRVMFFNGYQYLIEVHNMQMSIVRNNLRNINWRDCQSKNVVNN